MIQRTDKNKVLYSAAQTPPPATLILSSLQHMLLVLSLGMAMPVSIARAAGLDVSLSASLLAAALFSMGFTSILQTMQWRFLGSGYQSLSVGDSAAISACIMAVEIGGIPLLLGMTIFSGVLRLGLGSCIFRLRKLFPPEVTGTMVFILGLNLVPTGFKYFLGSSLGTADRSLHLLVAGLTLLFMLACALFIKPLKPYTALAGVVFGFGISAAVGLLDLSSLREIGTQGLFSLPIYKELSVAFDMRMVLPFLIVTVAAVVDNIGDFSACQRMNDPGREKPDWRSIEGGIRGCAVGTVLAGMLGGCIQSTATTNIGIAGASGITSRKVAYLAGAMLMVVSFVPGLTGLLSLIPEPVLGAVLMYSMCYIMAGGFSTLSSRAMDDRRILSIFLSIGFSASSLVPGLYSFLPDGAEQVLVSPMVMGVCVLLITTLLTRLGTRRRFSFETGVDSYSIPLLNKQIEEICRQWCVEREVLQKLQIGLDGLCEGLEEHTPGTQLAFNLMYDQLQVKLQIRTANAQLEEADFEEAALTSLSLSITMLRNMFDNVRLSIEDGAMVLYVDADV
ncbi:MAG: purine/pyrimidine permease [Anaerotignum sp.]|nr:purine/pyrimidine permease [Anaerotignum sp.]